MYRYIISYSLFTFIRENKKIMKKLFFAAVALSAITFASCGNKTTNQAGAADTVDTAVVDTAAISQETQSTLDNLKSQLTTALKSGDKSQITAVIAGLAANYKSLIDSDKLQEALSYGAKAKALVAQYKDQILSAVGNNSTVSSLLSAVEKLPTDAATTAESAKAAFASLPASAAAALKAVPASALTKAADAVSGAKDAAGAAVESAKDAAAAKVNAAKEDAQNKANAAVDDAKQKTNAAVDNAKQKTKDAANKAIDGAAKKLGL
jgi:vacuolar-type H+-ATPase subunit H